MHGLKRIGAVVAIILITLAGLGTGATARTGYTPVGKWEGVNTRSDGDHPSKHVFKADGTFSNTNEQNTTTKGKWWTTGTNTFHIRVRGEKVYDENGVYFAYVDFDQDAVQSGANYFTSSGPSSFYLADGTLVGTYTTTFTMHRV